MEKINTNLGISCEDHECSVLYSYCLQNICHCINGSYASIKSNNISCIRVGNTYTNSSDNLLHEKYDGSHMLPIMIVLGIMFVGMCVALNLFSRARFRESRSLFTRDNPRLVKSLSSGSSKTSVHHKNPRTATLPGLIGTTLPPNLVSSANIACGSPCKEILINDQISRQSRHHLSGHSSINSNETTNKEQIHHSKYKDKQMKEEKFEEIPIASTSKC